MVFITADDGFTVETQMILNDFLGHYADPTSYRNLIKRIPSEMGISDFKQLSYEDCQFLMNKYQGTDSYSHCIESLFRYLYLNDVLKDNYEFGMQFGDKDKIRKHFERLKNKDIKREKMQKESETSLSFVQIEKLIEYCNEVDSAIDFSSYKNLRMAFAFYAMFFQGISVNGLKNMDIKTYSKGEVILDGKRIAVPEKFYSMFEYALENGKVGKYQYLSKNIEDLGKAVGINKLVPKAITMTSKKYQFICPICGEQYFSFGENWKIVNGKIICTICAEQLVEKDVKKNVIFEWDTKNIELITTDEKEKITRYISSYDKLKSKLKIPCDFEEWNKYLKLIGELGEKYVYEREVKKLIELKREDLAECVNADIAKDHNNGYDILSYTGEGEELHIEVKATPGNWDIPFYMSKNEWHKANECKERGKLYELHRVYNVGKENIGIKIYKDIQLLKREDVLYKVFADIEEE